MGYRPDCCKKYPLSSYLVGEPQAVVITSELLNLKNLLGVGLLRKRSLVQSPVHQLWGFSCRDQRCNSVEQSHTASCG